MDRFVKGIFKIRGQGAAVRDLKYKMLDTGFSILDLKSQEQRT